MRNKGRASIFSPFTSFVSPNSLSYFFAIWITSFLMNQNSHTNQNPLTSQMGSLFSLTLVLLSWALLPSTRSEVQAIKPYHLLDLLIRDFTFKSFNSNLETGLPYSIHLPSNFSDIRVRTARFRCGSLRRYGAKFEEFRLGIGVKVSPCVERVMIVTQNLGHNWSSIYFQNYDLSGYQLVSPVLGLLAYNAGSDVNSGAPFEVGIMAREGEPITINFSNTIEKDRVGARARTRINETKSSPLCVSFESNGKVTLARQAKPHVCAARRNGHFGLVVEDPSPGQARLTGDEVREEKPWKVAVGSTVGAALGAFLIGLLLVAMFVRVKKRSRMDECERRAYEEEALQVSMVGHVRAPIAPGTRTGPAGIEKDYMPPRHHRPS